MVSVGIFCWNWKRREWNAAHFFWQGPSCHPSYPKLKTTYMEWDEGGGRRIVLVLLSMMMGERDDLMTYYYDLKIKNWGYYNPLSHKLQTSSVVGINPHKRDFVDSMKRSFSNRSL